MTDDIETVSTAEPSGVPRWRDRHRRGAIGGAVAAAAYVALGASGAVGKPTMLMILTQQTWWLGLPVAVVAVLAALWPVRALIGAAGLAAVPVLLAIASGRYYDLMSGIGAVLLLAECWVVGAACGAIGRVVHDRCGRARRPA